MTAMALTQDRAGLIAVLESSLYPGASRESIELVIGYCEAAGLDPMQKPVHIVPMWDSKAKRMRDVIMPGVGLYRTQAARTGQLAGVSEPEFGPDVTDDIGGAKVTYPEWCRVTVRRQLDSGHIAEFTAREFWRENYAIKGGQEKSIAPNAMWSKRPRGQLAKCAQAQALRIAFPELGSAPTADEMEGKVIADEAAAAGPGIDMGAWLARVDACADQAALTAEWKSAVSECQRIGPSAKPTYDAIKAAVVARGAAIKATDESRTVDAAPVKAQQPAEESLK